MLQKLPTIINKNTVVVASTKQVSHNLNEDSVILSLNSGNYYGLNEVGTSIWASLEKAKTVEQILNTILLNYDVDPVICLKDIIEVLQQMYKEELIEVINEQT